jgi:hypothetical protein
MNHKVLESIRDFLIYVSQNYSPIVPFLKGLHLTIDNWRPDQDSEGWKLSRAQIEAKYVTDKEIELELEESLRPVVTCNVPLKVKAAERLKDYIDVLFTLTEDERPSLRRIRARIVGQIRYCFGDAPGAGFGWSIDMGKEVYYEYGEWSEAILEESSNYRELRNLVNDLINAG